MLGIILIIVAIIALTKLLGNDSKRDKELERVKRRQDEMARDAKEREREQKELAREQERMAKEQERQAKELAKHEEQLAKLEFTVSKAQFDIDYLNERVANLDAMRDNLMMKQSACTPMSSEWEKYQKKILVLDNQIHSAESRMEKAQFDMERAKAKMSA